MAEPAELAGNGAGENHDEEDDERRHCHAGLNDIGLRARKLPDIPGNCEHGFLRIDRVEKCRHNNILK